MPAPRKPKRPSSEGGTEYRFKIDAWTPDTIPMARLAEYMAQLATLLGERTAVHFRRITRGSAVLVQKIDRQAVPKVRDRVMTVRAGDATGDAMRAYQAINKFLRDDNAIGVLRDDAPRGIIIRFPGREQAEEKFSAVRQQGSLDGIVTGIRGKDETIHITIQVEGQQVSGCFTTRTIAKQLGAKLFEPVRLFGRGRWNRDSEGVWSLENFKIESFQSLEDVPLSSALAQLRAIKTEWDDDSYEELRTIREGPGGKRNGGH
jgi:hypothetical protein